MKQCRLVLLSLLMACLLGTGLGWAQQPKPGGTLRSALPIALGGYYQGILMASPKAFETYGQDWLRHPVGTGPFKFKEWLPGERVILEKNPNYFKKGLPYLDTLEYRVMKDPLTASTA